MTDVGERVEALEHGRFLRLRNMASFRVAGDDPQWLGDCAHAQMDLGPRRCDRMQ
jgi:hypothetical protein